MAGSCCKEKGMMIVLSRHEGLGLKAVEEGKGQG